MINKLDVKLEIKHAIMLLKASKMPLNATTKTHYFDIICPITKHRYSLDLYIYKRLLNAFKTTRVLNTTWAIDNKEGQMVISGGDLNKGAEYRLNMINAEG